ncbi:hypothetical protein HUW51_07810 [Adhaeribacter swui]|uniref:PepSY domain-containing protein n=1 Tax=Adhaeribacter swui TaxID=2086471 RepID=A0A7G7G653_9BACT|nr:hypothetical protein [Adhaeribacter swui]QNF32637.1 hypothetical protein HUW51_07810 [Adhaeribacter swui]
MKKIVVSAFSLFLLGAVSANAQTTTGGQSGTATQTTTPSATSGATQSTTPAGTQSGTQDGTAASTATTPAADATGAAATGAATSTAAGTATGAGTAADAASTAAPAGTAVALEELPAAVKATLASEKLKTWTPSGAQLVTDASGKEYYSIELKQANQIGTVKLSKEGKPVK